MAFWSKFRRARESNEERASSVDTPEPSQGLQRELTRRLLEYGLTNDERMVDEITPLYLRALEEIPARARLDLLVELVTLVDERKLSSNALMPFVFRDTAPVVISTAALHLACTWPESEHDPVRGVRELAAFARRLVNDGDESRAASILSGLVALGDRRVFQCLGACWRFLSPEGRQLLAAGLQGRSYAGLIDWLVSWLEDCEGGEFGAVAGRLAHIPTLTKADLHRTVGMDEEFIAALPDADEPAGVVEIRRALPVWDVPPEEVLTVSDRFSFPEYAERIRPRLLQIAADEQPPRVMYDVLKCWGVDNTRRLLAGIAMRGAGALEGPRPLLSDLDAAAGRPSGIIDGLVPLEDAVFLARDGQLLLSWSIFNPYGPTWSCLGLLPTENPEVSLLFYRMLNPFLQESGVVGIVRGGDTSSPTVIGQMVEEVFARGRFEVIDEGTTVHLIGGGAPDVVTVFWNDPAFRDSVQRAFLSSPRLHEIDVVGALHEIREFSGRPWDRATKQRNDAFARMTPEGLIPLPDREGETTEEVIEEWLDLVQDQHHWIPELAHFPSAWHGSIDNVPHDMAQFAYTFWQLDDFLARFGFPFFRELAEVVAPDNPPGDDSGELGDGDLEPDYRTAYQRLREQTDPNLLETGTPAEQARFFGTLVIVRQMASAEHHAPQGCDTAKLRRLAREPWALGYMAGVASGVIGRFGLEPRSSDAMTVIAAIHQAGLGHIASQDAVSLSESAMRKSGFRDGLERGMGDAASFDAPEDDVPALLQWIDERLGL